MGRKELIRPVASVIVALIFMAMCGVFYHFGGMWALLFFVMASARASA